MGDTADVLSLLASLLAMWGDGLAFEWFRAAPFTQRQ